MENELKQKMKHGKNAYGIMISEIYVPNLVRLLAQCGFDFLLLDCEHGYFDMTETANIIAVANGINMPIIVRVTQPSRTSVTKYMDMGVNGVLLSNCSGVKEARELVNVCYYAPIGDRGISTFRAHTGYQKGNARKIMQDANTRNLVICQIESPGAVEEIDEILSIVGVDGVLVGPNDLSQHMGIWGEYEHPKMKRALRRIADAAHQHEKWSGIISNNQDLLRFCKEIGMTCFSSGSELSALAAGAQVELEKMKSL